MDAERSDSSTFHVKFVGPSDSTCMAKVFLFLFVAPYAGGVFEIKVDLPEQYPFKSPSIGFVNRIFHPNIDERSGSVCLDVINQTWTPLYSLVNIFDTFLPQLLAYPNAADPLNPDAAQLWNMDRLGFETKVKEYIGKYASPGACGSVSTSSADSTPDGVKRKGCFSDSVSHEGDILMEISDMSSVGELELD